MAWRNLCVAAAGLLTILAYSLPVEGCTPTQGHRFAGEIVLWNVGENRTWEFELGWVPVGAACELGTSWNLSEQRLAWAHGGHLNVFELETWNREQETLDRLGGDAVFSLWADRVATLETHERKAYVHEFSTGHPQHAVAWPYGYSASLLEGSRLWTWSPHNESGILYDLEQGGVELQVAALEDLGMPSDLGPAALSDELLVFTERRYHGGTSSWETWAYHLPTATARNLTPIIRHDGGLAAHEARIYGLESTPGERTQTLWGMDWNSDATEILGHPPQRVPPSINQPSFHVRSDWVAYGRTFTEPSIPETSSAGDATDATRTRPGAPAASSVAVLAVLATATLLFWKHRSA